MKIKTFLILLAVGIALALAARSAKAQTNSTTMPPVNITAQLGISGAAQQFIDAVSNSGLFTATNWDYAPYATYSANAKDHFGGGVLASYNFPSLSSSLGGVGACIGADWMGSWSLISGNVTLKTTTHPFNSVLASIVPASWANIAAQPFALAGIGQPMGSGGSGAATIWDVGYNVDLYHSTGGWVFGAGICWGEWMNAGTESGHREHFFLNIHKGF
jgi:hypothetical protein